MKETTEATALMSFLVANNPETNKACGSFFNWAWKTWTSLLQGRRSDTHETGSFKMAVGRAKDLDHEA